MNTLSLPHEAECPSAGATDAATVLHLPGVEQRWRFAARHASLALANRLGGHHLQVWQAGRYRATVQLGNALRQRWCERFGVPAAQCARTPLLFSQGVSTLLILQLFNDLGLDLRHALHLQHSMRHVAGVEACVAAQVQQVVAGVTRVLRIDDDKVLVEFEQHFVSPEGRLLAVQRDACLVRQVPAADMAGLATDATVLRQLLGLCQPAVQLRRGRDGSATCRVQPAAACPDLGDITGDTHLQHRLPALARWCGTERPLLQGLGLRNQVVRHLAEMGRALDRLQMTFAKPAEAGQALDLVVQGCRFELHDESGQMVAFGTTGASTSLGLTPADAAVAWV